ncbi:non-heme iron oxygenase ferredoxin subunit [Symmachiella dynata]|uniref:non-heme iron oxygenase ferredoxin subunit n=1 Tax=Symmachiella dynata TaxID=2527995 RepID=UPI00118C4DB9|nr:non-heme iron oxygenase ferredoxin subunit [Symmachiella dynata]QDT49725.1 Naphthalene 1,2-dioxygenase/salicylate 5-hydroxylase system, ferredoxin component [Symmachiella dynata]|tara:strand:- start:56 stop:367 length:312 start_codon:yes stop_codon:yes gene_type:complete
MSEFQRVASVDDIAPGERIAAIVDEVPVLVLRVGDNYYCIEDVCTHDGQPLTDGPLEGNEITCPRHGARFDVTTGAAVCMPAFEAVPTYEVKIEDGAVLVSVT